MMPVHSHRRLHSGFWWPTAVFPDTRDPLRRYEPTVTPDQVEDDIKAALAA